MYLKRLEIQGFKSFAKKTVLEFDKGITAIVGPNGSGKSNVADSLRWVLGEQSAKLLRGKKSEDVIFAGSDKKVKLGFAEVVATFDNGDRKIPVDASEVSIGRRVDRSGDSEYLINGNKVRLLDIVELVLKSSIGTSRYTVIGQGTIDQMILAGPTEIKNLLDEASGVKTYYTKREKTLRRLEQTAQNLMRAEDLMVEIEPRLKSLRRQAKRMEAREQVEVELKVYQREWFTKQYWVLNDQFAKFNERFHEAHTDVVNLEKVIADFRVRLSERQNKNIYSEEFRNVQEKMAELQKEKNKLLEHMSMLRGKMESQKTVMSSDPNSLRVEAHRIGQMILQTQEQLKTVLLEAEKGQSELLQKKELFGQIDEKLKMVYEALSQPEHSSFESLGHALTSLDESFGRFYETIRQAGSVDEMRSGAEHFKEKFVNFRATARELLSDPHAAQTKLKHELDGFLREKDVIQAELQASSIHVSKVAMQKDYLEKQLLNLNDEKARVELELKRVEAGSDSSFVDMLVKEEMALKGDVDKITQSLLELDGRMKIFYEEEERSKQVMKIEEKEYLEKQDQLSRLKDVETGIQVEKAKVEAHIGNLWQEMVNALGEVVAREIAAKKVLIEREGLEGKITNLKHQLDLIGGVDELTIQEYRETEQRYEVLNSQVTDLKKGVEDLRQIIDELDGHIKTAFNEAFHRINGQFEQYFRMLFNGGRAYLSLVRHNDESLVDDTIDENDKEVEGEAVRAEEKMLEKYERGALPIVGVDIKATPPGKKLASLQALSGGERSLTSIALLCSLLTCFPSPFVVLDEVDAALDDANTIRFGQILGTLSHQTQFITITHNRETMAHAKSLYGVTMGDDSVSKLLSVKFEQATNYAK